MTTLELGRDGVFESLDRGDDGVEEAGREDSGLELLSIESGQEAPPTGAEAAVEGIKKRSSRPTNVF